MPNRALVSAFEKYLLCLYLCIEKYLFVCYNIVYACSEPVTLPRFHALQSPGICCDIFCTVIHSELVILSSFKPFIDPVSDFENCYVFMAEDSRGAAELVQACGKKTNLESAIKTLPKNIAEEQPQIRFILYKDNPFKILRGL